MNVHCDWTTPGFSFAPVASATGPFASRDLLRVWWEHRGAKRGRLLLVENDTAFLPLYEDEAGIMFLGEEHLVDYHTPMGTGVPELVSEFLRSLPGGTPFRFDSLPEAASVVMYKGCTAAGIDVVPARHEVAAVLGLPDTFEDYLSSVGKKERHEIRRKRRRFEADQGRARIERASGREAVAVFADLHRRSSGDKGEFMSHVMEALFTSLNAEAGFVVDFLYGERPDPAAAAFSFEDESGYYLYNSAYDPDVAPTSPGIVMLAMLIEAAIAARLPRFDFLKGDEAYKFRHGAQPRPLLVIEGVT